MAQPKKRTPIVETDFSRLWKMGYARESFKYVQTICDYIVDNEMDRRTPIHHPLCVALVIFYCRPFKQSKIVGAIPETMVPSPHRYLHRQLVTIRDQVAAHTDADSVKHGDRPANNVQLIINEDGTGALRINEIKFSPEAIDSIRELVTTLIRKTTYHLERLWPKMARKIPDWPGHYLMDAPRQDFIKIHRDPTA